MCLLNAASHMTKEDFRKGKLYFILRRMIRRITPRPSRQQCPQTRLGQY